MNDILKATGEGIAKGFIDSGNGASIGVGSLFVWTAAKSADSGKMNRVALALFGASLIASGTYGIYDRLKKICYETK